MSAKTVHDIVDHAVTRGQPTLSEHESKRLLAAYGIPVNEEELVCDAAAAGRAAARLGYPVAVKACSPNLLHKTDRGLVQLGVESAAAVEQAVAKIDDALSDTPIDGYLVERMVPGLRELIVGAVRDATFGPCVMLGLGGVLVEAVGDVAFRLAPLEQRDAVEMIGELRAQAIFGPFRNEPAADIVALTDVLVAAGRILTDNRRIAQIDINPLIISDSRPVAVDALVTLSDETGETE